MSTRLHPALRTSLSRLAIAGAATLASVVTIAPPALAAEEPTSSEPAQAPEAAAGPVAEPTSASAAPDGDPTATPAEAPAEPVDSAQTEPPVAAPATQRVSAAEATGAVPGETAYVDQQITVSAKIADGAYVAPGTTTSGTEFTITIDGAAPLTCTTDASTLSGTETFCLFDDGNGRRTTALTVPAGAAVNVEQTGAADGLVVPGLNQNSRLPVAEGDPNPIAPFAFEQFGPAPTAQPDQVQTTEDQSITVDVLGNDGNVNPDVVLALGSDFDPATAPDNGTAQIVDGKIVYAPNQGYVGSDEFKYSVTDGNGTTFGTVIVNVVAAEVAPNYGSQKYRIGVQIADGSYVPAGTTTAGSTFTIVTTSQKGDVTIAHCTTDTTSGPSGYSACPGDGSIPYYYGDFYTAPAGATVVVTQDTVADGNLVPAADPMVIEPCDRNARSSCSDQSLTFNDRGSILPEANDDTARTSEGDAVRIDVLANDVSADPNTDLTVDSSPGHGDAKVVGQANEIPADPEVGPITSLRSSALLAPGVLAVPNAGSLAIEYTPDAGFTGVDTFDYALTNGNGSSVATVTVTVVDGQVIDDSGDAAGPNTNGDAALPDTGGSSPWPLGLAALMLAAGTWLVTLGRRKQHGVHTG